jgi:hypothetical protein
MADAASHQTEMTVQNEQNKSPPCDKILERLKNLFALGQSSNQHEAELTMQKARTPDQHGPGRSTRRIEA